MDPDFRDFVLSPVLSGPTKNREILESRNKNQMNLEDVYKRLLQHLKKGETIPRGELKCYLEQTKKMNCDDSKNNWFLMKIKGLVNYMLKKRSDFQRSVIEGQITISERSASEQITTVNSIHEPQEFHSQPNSDTANLPSNFLTNDNFLTISSNPNATKMETESSYNYSQDLFPETIGSLCHFSQENYQLLKRLTNNEEASNTSEESDFIFKVPQAQADKIDEVYKIHNKVQENYDSILSLTQSLPILSNQDDTTCDINMDNSPSQTTQSRFNLSDFDLNISNDELKLEFDALLEDTENWVTEIANNLIHLQVGDCSDSFNIPTDHSGATSTPNSNGANASNVSIVTQHSEENQKILRDVCSEFKKNLQQEMKSNKKLEILKELLSAYDLSTAD